MYAVRLWSVRHARGLNAFYRGFEGVLKRMHGVFRALGYERIERPVAAIERVVKGALFDCRMCGQCVLSSTGMSCPMNCPKNLRNGPCGGVRDNGHCEVKPEMRCVWVEAYHGSQRIPNGVEAMAQVQLAVDQRLKGRSSWLKIVRELHPEPQAKPLPARPGAAPAQAGTAPSVSGQSVSGQAGSGLSGLGWSGLGQAGSDQSGSGRSGLGQSGSGQSGSCLSGSDQSGSDQCGSEKGGAS